MNFSFDLIPFEERIKSKCTSSEILTHQEAAGKIASNHPQPKKYKKKRRRGNQVKNYWSKEQQRSYIVFLNQNREILKKSLKQRKKYCINKNMSKMIKTRNLSQCHSHHQKMIKKYGSIQKIISTFETLSKNSQKQVQKCPCKEKNQLSFILDQYCRNTQQIELGSLREQLEIKLTFIDYEQSNGQLTLFEKLSFNSSKMEIDL